MIRCLRGDCGLTPTRAANYVSFAASKKKKRELRNDKKSRLRLPK